MKRSTAAGLAIIGASAIMRDALPVLGPTARPKAPPKSSDTAALQRAQEKRDRKAHRRVVLQRGRNA